MCQTTLSSPVHRQQTRSFNWPVENTDPNIMGNITVAQKGAKEDAFCMGCGVDIVADDTTAAKEEVLGFSVTTSEKPKTFRYQQSDLWRKTKIENWSFCPRCLELQALEEEEHEETNNPGALAPATDDLDTTLLQLTPDHGMVRVFREHVKLVRGLRDAVVIVCADAVNTHGTMLTKIRNYVGGNTILLAVTRCDLLPPYVWQGGDAWGITQVMRERAEHMQPASIYFCSEERNAMRELGGVQQLVHDVWENLNGTWLFIL